MAGRVPAAARRGHGRPRDLAAAGTARADALARADSSAEALDTAVHALDNERAARLRAEHDLAAARERAGSEAALRTRADAERDRLAAELERIRAELADLRERSAADLRELVAAVRGVAEEP
ncbi:hypothetical protein BJF78_34275 [Pseudonocardia sp. CNS-139]|nr:hypothetical protein BJF78_34275 [Pseudonocardia sp. CNS-139]